MAIVSSFGQLSIIAPKRLNGGLPLLLPISSPSPIYRNNVTPPENLSHGSKYDEPQLQRSKSDRNMRGAPTIYAGCATSSFTDQNTYCCRMKNTPDIQPDHLSLIQRILQQHLPQGSKVWAFGSRVTGTAKKFSDLDLAIDVKKPLSLEIISNLASDFEESDLPYKVDLVDWATVDESFREKIQSERVLLWPAV